MVAMQQLTQQKVNELRRTLGCSEVTILRAALGFDVRSLRGLQAREALEAAGFVRKGKADQARGRMVNKIRSKR
jgi:hypothetical protein